MQGELLSHIAHSGQHCGEPAAGRMGLRMGYQQCAHALCHGHDQLCGERLINSNSPGLRLPCVVSPANSIGLERLSMPSIHPPLHAHRSRHMTPVFD